MTGQQNMTGSPHRFDAVILAGGASARLGRNKLSERLGPLSVLEVVVASLSEAEAIVVVGTPDTVDLTKLRWATERNDQNLILTSEQPAGSGPAMGIAAGVRALNPPKVEPGRPIVILGGDMPFVAPAIPALVSALPDNPVAALTDEAGEPQYLASVWLREELLAATNATQPGDSARSLFQNLDFFAVRDQTNATFDIDTESDLATAQTRLKRS